MSCGYRMPTLHTCIVAAANAADLRLGDFESVESLLGNQMEEVYMQWLGCSIHSLQTVLTASDKPCRHA